MHYCAFKEEEHVFISYSICITIIGKLTVSILQSADYKDVRMMTKKFKKSYTELHINYWITFTAQCTSSNIMQYI